MMIYVRPFKAEDIKAFRPIEPLTTDLLIEPELAKSIEKSGLAITGYIRNKIVCCGGVHPITDDPEKVNEQGEAWIRLSRKCLKYPVATMRWLKAGLKIVEETYPFRQLNAVIRADFERGIKMAKRLGFRETQRCVIHNKPQIIFSKRVKE